MTTLKMSPGPVSVPRDERVGGEEFDEKFIERLGLIYEQSDDTVKCLEGKWIFKFDWAIFYLGTIYSLVDEASEERPFATIRRRQDSDRKWQGPSPLSARGDPMRHFKNRTSRLFARYTCRIVLIIYIFCLTEVFRNDYLQYRYDICLFRYNHMAGSTNWRARNESKIKLDETYANFRAAGSPFIKTRFVAAQAQFYLAFVSLLVYIQPAISFGCPGILQILPLPAVQDSTRLVSRATKLPGVDLRRGQQVEGIQSEL